MHDGWRQTTLGELCSITKGSSPTQKTTPGPYPLIVTGPRPLSSNAFQFDGEAVCVPLVSSTGHGHASLKRVHYASGKFAVANIVAVCTPRDEAGVSTRFLYHYLQHFKDTEIVTRMKGTANVSLSLSNLAAVPVNLPPLAEQRRIVDLISAVDDAVLAAETEAESADQLQDHLSASHFASISEYEPLHRLATSRLGKMLSKSTNRGVEAPYLRNVNVRWGSVDLSELKTMPFTAADRIQFSLKAGDLLVCEGGEVGRSAVLGVDLPGVYFQKALHRVRCADTLNSYYLQIYLAHAVAKNLLVDFVSGSTIKHLTGEKLSRIPIPVTNLAAQDRLVADVHAICGVASAARTTAASLRKLRSELLDVLLSGEGEIPSSYDWILEGAA